MNIFYLLSVVSSRFLNVLTVITLSYLLSARSFGQYSLVATNAILINLTFTSWISGSIWRDVSKASDENYRHYVAAAIKYATLMGAFFTLITPALLFFLGNEDRYFAVTFALAPLLMMIDLTLVILNARHDARAYSLLSFLRGALSLGIAIILIALGWGIWGALAGQVLGILLALLLLRDVRKMFCGFLSAPLVWRDIREKFQFGVVSAMALNFYMFANALSRNFVAYKLGEAQAGYFSLAADMFFAPVALFAISLSLSNIPKLYGAHGVSATEKARHTSDFIMATMAVALPYAVGGGLMGPQLALLLLHQDTGAAVSKIAGYGAVQGACFAFLSALSTLALTAEKVKLALLFSLFVVVVVALGMLLASPFLTLKAYAASVTLMLVLTSVGSITLMKPLFGVKLQGRELLKFASAATIMSGAMVLMARFGQGTAMTIIGIIVGGALYLGLTLILRSQIVGGILRLSHI